MIPKINRPSATFVPEEIPKKNGFSRFFWTKTLGGRKKHQIDVAVEFVWNVQTKGRRSCDGMSFADYPEVQPQSLRPAALREK
jgi:hypothetical protein